MRLARQEWERALGRDWVMLTCAAWFAIACWVVATRWPQVHWLALGDTDDNLRLAQVRALLAGQGWYDLRQYRLNPPAGFDIHWSRIVDLPIAGLIVLLRPFVGVAQAERLACGIAPLLPLLPAAIALGATVRRLVHPLAWPAAIVVLLCSSAAMLMFMPERIDHHGWQLACLAVTVAGLVDPKRVRGGVTVGLASAVSLSIGLELLPYTLMEGAVVTLRWVLDRDDARRLRAYALTLGIGVAAGYGGFASWANTALRCDALTPVYLTTLVAAGAALLALGVWNPARPAVRLGAAVAAGAVLAAGFAWLFPQCLGRPEQVSPELARNWLDNVREAKPIYQHPFRLGFSIAALPLAGLLGAVVATRRAWGTPAFARWLPVAAFAGFACLMLLWQVRAGPAAQMLAVPGAVALAWLVVPVLLGHPSVFVRVLGPVAAFLLCTGTFAGLAIRYLHIDPPDPRTRRVNRANGQCFSLPRLQALDAYPAATVLTFTDLGPRLIVATHHSAVAGPYHRNGDAILDVQHAFTRSDANLLATARRHGATLLLVCPNMSESTIYRARGPGGFYDRLAKGARPGFLQPLPLPAGSPFRLYRIQPRAADQPR